MRTPFLAGNWKMHKTIPEALAFVEAVKGPLSELSGVDAGINAPAIQLAPLSEAVKGSGIILGAQNMHFEESGAFTGEISPLMLRGVVSSVIIGHSERRGIFGETDEMVNKKIKTALAHDLLPIVCVGETLEQNEAGQTESVVSSQVKAAFDGISAVQAEGMVVAYEPIWAIGTGKAATSDDAQRIIGDVVRKILADLYSDSSAQKIRIQYGGSVKPANVEELMSQPDIDGGLVGGASLDPESFVTLCRVTAEVKS